MKTILLLGAGKSSGSLIQYLLQNAENKGFNLVIGDKDPAVAEEKINNHPYGKAIGFDINNAAQRHEEIMKADLVISLLPPALHLPAAEDCLRLDKNLVTASYI